MNNERQASAELRAEFERLTEIEKLYMAGCEHWNAVYQVILKERDELRAEVERLTAAVDKAHEYLAEVPPRIADARRALEAKP